MTKKYKQLTKDTDFAEYLKKQLKNPAIKKAYDEEGMRLDVAFQLNKLREKQGLTQQALAYKLNTTQSVIARMEQGRQNFTLDTLHRLADVFGKELRVEFA
ncbi:MAG: helix-turn-helix transcriptional regulator [Candidatus Jacksonbacteria bacterium]|nr:helix-turn-helix transcriptional regulator [Candidatus Jacksonbacteria bacterium]